MSASHLQFLPLAGGILLFSSAIIARLNGGLGSFEINSTDLVLILFIIIIALQSYFLRHLHTQRVKEINSSESEKQAHLQELADLHLKTIESLAIAIDAKDQTTHGHVRRTQIYAMELGKILGVSESELDALRAGALLHDIGKLAVPEYILNKPGKLTAAEFEKMKIHTTVGGDIIKRVNFPYPVEEIVRHHHEKWDGSGYPSGLRGEEIPLVARIISVIDFFDATRCDRPYRPGMKREESLSLLREMGNSSFDPRVVDAFIANIDIFDQLIDAHDRDEQVPAEKVSMKNSARPDAELASELVNSSVSAQGFNAIAEAQREVFALHEIAQTIGSSLNLLDTTTLVASKLRSIVPFETCVIYLIDEPTGKASAVYSTGQHAEAFTNRRIQVGDGVTGWVVANSRSMCNTHPELDLFGLDESVIANIKCVLVSPLIREDGAFGAISLYSSNLSSYSSEHIRLLESVAHQASSALNNALIYERTKESALADPLTGLPNARALHLMLEQRLAECQRLKRESLSILHLDLDEFKKVNESWGHGIGDRVLTAAVQIIKSQLRQMDGFSRYAGDDFVAVMPMASSDMAAMVAERIRTALESKEFSAETDRSIKLCVSIGVASYPADGETPDQLLKSAERHLQCEKHRKLHAKGYSQTPVVTCIESYRS